MLIQLCQIDHMYQYSLDAFVSFFYKAMERAPANDDRDKRVKALRSKLRFTIYEVTSRGLFEKHKLIFLVQLTFNLLRRGVIGDDVGFDLEGLSYLLRSPRSFSEDNKVDW